MAYRLVGAPRLSIGVLVGLDEPGKAVMGLPEERPDGPGACTLRTDSPAPNLQPLRHTASIRTTNPFEAPL